MIHASKNACNVHVDQIVSILHKQDASNSLCTYYINFCLHKPKEQFIHFYILICNALGNLDIKCDNLGFKITLS